MTWTGHVAPMGEKRNTYRILVEKTECKRPLGIPRYRWVKNIKMNDMVWIELIWLRIGKNESSCEHGNEISSSIKCREFLE
jgi:hypothetical protein